MTDCKVAMSFEARDTNFLTFPDIPEREAKRVYNEFAVFSNEFSVHPEKERILHQWL